MPASLQAPLELPIPLLQHPRVITENVVGRISADDNGFLRVGFPCRVRPRCPLCCFGDQGDHEGCDVALVVQARDRGWQLRETVAGCGLFALRLLRLAKGIVEPLPNASSRLVLFSLLQQLRTLEQLLRRDLECRCEFPHQIPGRPDVASLHPREPGRGHLSITSQLSLGETFVLAQASQVLTQLQASSVGSWHFGHLPS